MACGAALGALIAVSGGPAADAQTTTPDKSAKTTDVGEVVVTARKREERLRDVPIAASVIDSASLEKRASVEDTGAIVTSVPGARFNNLTSSTLSEVSLRGSGTARGTNADTGVGLYANGVYVGGGLQFARNYTQIDFFDLGRAEILRGTLGALYGRNAVGGAINLISQQPLFDNSGGALLDYGPDIKKKLASVVENFKVNDEFAVRLGAQFVDQESGLYKEVSLGRASDEQHGWILRGQARYEHGPLDATFLMQYSHLTIGGGEASLTIKAGTGCPATAAAVCYLKNYFQTPYVLPFNTLSYVNQGVTQGILTVNYDLNWAKLTSVTSFRRRSTDFVSDNDLMDAATLAGLRANGTVTGGANQRTDSYQNLGDLTYTYYEDIHLAGGDRLNWLGGVEFVRIGSRYNPLQVTANPVGAETFNGLNYISWAPYGSVGYNVTDTVNLSAELRYTDDQKGFWSYGDTFPAHVVNVPLVSRTFNSTNWSYNLIADWKFMPEWMAYAKVGTGYRAGGFNSGVGVAPPLVAPRPLQPTFGNEESITYEVGAKGNLLANLYTTIAAYKTHVKGALTQVDNGCFVGNPQCSVRPTNFAINGGDADLWGIEWEGNLSYHLGPGSGLLKATASRQSGTFKGGVYDGFDVPQTPDWLYSANLDYNVPVGSVMLFGDVNYIGQRGGKESVAVGTTAPASLKPYDVVDLRLGVRWKSTELAYYVSNLTNDQYTFIDSGTSTRWSPPRTYGIQLRYRW